MFEVLFLTAFCTSFWRRVHNSKEIVNLQDLFVLTVSYIVIKTYIHQQCITILLKGYILFMGCLYYLSIYFHSSYCIQYDGGITEITSMPV